MSGENIEKGAGDDKRNGYFPHPVSPCQPRAPKQPQTDLRYDGSSASITAATQQHRNTVPTLLIYLLGFGGSGHEHEGAFRRVRPKPAIQHPSQLFVEPGAARAGANDNNSQGRRGQRRTTRRQLRYSQSTLDLKQGRDSLMQRWLVVRERGVLMDAMVVAKVAWSEREGTCGLRVYRWVRSRRREWPCSGIGSCPCTLLPLL